MPCNEVRVSAGEDEQVLWMEAGDGCTAVRMCLMPLNWTLKAVKMMNGRLGVFYTHTHMHILAARWGTG